MERDAVKNRCATFPDIKIEIEAARYAGTFRRIQNNNEIRIRFC